jgi:hypothetical protein
LHFADAAQTVNELAVDATGHPAPGNELTDVGVAGELERDASGFGNVGMVGRVSQKDAGAVSINADALEHGRKVRVLRGVTVRDADDLEAVRFDFLVGEDTNTGSFHGAEVFGVVTKLFMIASDEIDTVRRG